MHRKGLVNTSDLAPESPNDSKLDMSPLCSKQTTYTTVLLHNCELYITALRKLLTSVCMLYAGTEHLDDDVWEVMKPTDFFQFTIPFEMPGDTKV